MSRSDMKQPPKGNWKLTVGKLLAAWRDYPRTRTEINRFPAGGPIFVTGTHRSGTTWVAKMLAVPGLWYVHEPFNPNKQVWREEFTYAQPGSDQPDIDRHMRQVLAGGWRQMALLPHVDHPLMPLRLFPQPIRRVMLKDPLACLLTGYLTQRFDLKTLVLFRHPCGFVSSVCRLGWPRGKFLQAFLNDRALMDDHLAPWAGLMEQHTGCDDVASATVLFGVLNQVLWNQTQQQGLTWRRFEDLCDDPLVAFRDLFAWCDLPYDETVRRMHEQLCFGEAKDAGEYHPHAVARNSRAMADSWKQQLSDDEVQQVRDIWEQFAVPLYESGREWSTRQDHVAVETRS